MLKRLKSYLALYLIQKIGPIRYRELLKKFGTPEKVFKEGREYLEYLLKHSINVDSLFEEAEREIKLANTHGIKIVTYEDEEYPNYLKDFSYSPPILYILGDPESLKGFNIAIVGSRRATYYGKRVARRFAHEFAEAGITVISGGARGIDTEAHKGALEAGGKTVAVLGSGLLEPYPRENRRLFEEIAKLGGAVISEFPLHMKPLSENFPRRNRIISGLSRGVIVVEAGKISGALITVRWAMDQGKEVYSVPGPIDSKVSEGTNELIKKGAKVITGPEDVLEDLGIVSMPKSKPELPLLSEEEKAIFEKIGENPIHIDELAELLNTEPFRLLSNLLNLELKGLIEELPGNYYIRNPLYK